MEQNKTFHFSTYIDDEIFRDFAFFNSYLFNGRWISLTLFPLVMAGLGIVNLVTGSSFLFRLFLVLALVIPVLYVFYYRISIHNQIIINNLQDRQLAYTTLFKDKQIEVSNQSEKQPLEWEKIYRIFRYKKYFYLYVTQSRAFILPAEGLEDSTIADEFWDYAQEMAPEGRWKSYRNSK